MRNITIKASEVKKASDKAAKVETNCWQATICELLMLPKLAKRWQEFNPRHKGLRIEKHEGQLYPEGYARQNTVTDWATFAGYTLKADYWTWNSVPETGDLSRGFSHNPGTAYDGIRRETVYHFAYDLMAINSCIEQGRSVPQSYIDELFYDYKITFVNDLA